MLYRSICIISLLFALLVNSHAGGNSPMKTIELIKRIEYQRRHVASSRMKTIELMKEPNTNEDMLRLLQYYANC